MVTAASTVKSDTVAVLTVLPWYQQYNRGNGYKFYGITAVLGSKHTGISWGWGPGLQYYGDYGVGFKWPELMHQLWTVHLQVSVDLTGVGGADGSQWMGMGWGW